jgi:hypothetical protein
MKDGASLLDTTVVAPAHDLPVKHEHRTDGDPALGQPEAGLIDGGIEERVGHEEMLRARPARVSVSALGVHEPLGVDLVEIEDLRVHVDFEVPLGRVTRPKARTLLSR